MPLYCADTVAQKPGRAALLTLYVQTDRVTRFLLDGVLRIFGQNKRIHLLNPPKKPMITHILFFAIWSLQTAAVLKTLWAFKSLSSKFLSA